MPVYMFTRGHVCVCVSGWRPEVGVNVLLGHSPPCPLRPGLFLELRARSAGLAYLGDLQQKGSVGEVGMWENEWGCVLLDHGAVGW